MTRFSGSSRRTRWTPTRYHELDYFEQLGALEEFGAVPFDLVRLLLGQRLVERWELWRPSLEMLGTDAYPMFGALVTKMRRSVVIPASST